MIAQSLRASRASIVRVAGTSNIIAQRHYVSPSAVRKADAVQDMYLNELKRTKPTEIKASDAAAHVQKFTKPKAPASPEETGLSGELKDYQNQKVEVEGQASAGEPAAAEQDWFEEEPEEEEKAH
ncbi:MAG: hypothetical protein M1814_003429 [Vezdaea aestivalis]|nr:MAG: hypothetical protein M1814_003429 [Vezdaea aestivalis]